MFYLPQQSPISTTGKSFSPRTTFLATTTEKILEDCKIWISFFPRGRMNYYHLFFTFSTSFELGIREELTKLDRTSYLFKYENTLILFIYSDSGWTTCRHFSELEKKGILRDLRISIPVQWHRPEFKI
jgi:hypothetical protein